MLGGLIVHGCLRHVCSAMLLVLAFFKHGILKPLGGLGALCVDVGDPKMSNRVLDNEKEGDC